MNSKLITILAVVVGLLLLFLAGLYFVEPAKLLPHFIPGYDPQLTKHHFTHGIGALIIGLAAFVFAWFQSGKKSSK